MSAARESGSLHGDAAAAAPTMPVEPSIVSVPDLQAALLLERVRAKAAEARATAEWDADAQVDSILRTARSEAHARVREAARAKRARVAERCRKAIAEAETRDRTSSFALEHAFVARAMEALPGALARRWQRPEARRSWCIAAARLAAARLVSRDWHIEADAGVDDADRAAIAGCAESAGAKITWTEATAPGLRIVAGGVAVDATIDGLLADRAGVESLLLAALAGADAGAPPGSTPGPAGSAP